ncbi:Clr5 domain-containing protein [Pleurotus pulmonarius]
MDMLDPTIEGPPVPIRRPPQWNAWLDKYARQRQMSYAALLQVMEGITSDEFQALRCFAVQNLKTLTSGRAAATLSNTEWRHFKDKIMKKFPKMSHYEGAWPIRAIVAKYVAYRRNQFGIRKENEQTQEITKTPKKYRYLHYIGKPLSRTTLKYLTLNEVPLITPAPQIISSRPPPSTFGSVRAGPSRTPAVDVECFSAEDLLRFRPRKMQCIKCAHLAPLSEQAKSQRLFTKYISTIYQMFDYAEDVLTKMGIIDDYTLALLLQLPEEDRRRMFTTSAYCNVVDGIEISRHMNTLKHEMLKIDSSPSRPPASSASVSYSQNRASTSRPRPPVSYPSYSVSSNPDSTSFTMKCNACDFQPRVNPSSPVLEAFLTAKGLQSLLPVFTEWAIFTDDRFDMLRYSWSEDDRAALFNDDRDVKLTEFHRFALMMAFRQRD